MLKKLTIVAFAVLALATFSACGDGGGEGADEANPSIGALDGACKEDMTCNSGLKCNTDTNICTKADVIVTCEGVDCDDTPGPTSECLFDADCDSGKLCNKYCGNGWCDGICEDPEPTPECTVNADCGADKLCNSGKCEDIGGGGGGGGGSQSGGGSSGNGGGSLALTYQGAQGLLLGTKLKYAISSPITFPDANLKKAVIDAIKKVDPNFNKANITVVDCAKITKVEYHPYDDTDHNGDGIYCEDTSDIKIKSLEGLQFCKGIETINLSCNQIDDLSPLKGMTKLTTLDLRDNQISDIGALITNANSGGLGDGDKVYLMGYNPLTSDKAKKDIKTLKDKGVELDL